MARRTKLSKVVANEVATDSCGLDADWLGQRVWMDDDNQARLQLKLGNLHCSFCVSTIEKSLGRLDGVEGVSVSLAHEEGLVTYRPEIVGPQAIVDTLRAVGYSVRDPRKLGLFEEEASELRRERDRFQAALALTGVTLGLMGFYWVGGSPLSITWAKRNFAYGPWLILAMALTVMFVIGRPIMAMAWASLRRGILNQHVLLEAGALGGLLGGLLGLFVAPHVFPPGDFLSVSVFITAYHLLSGYVSALVRANASAAVHRLLALQPETARVLRDDHEVEVPIGEVRVGDHIRIRPGERVPLDGTVVSGTSAIDESLVTGEPIPIEKHLGDEVIGGSVNQMGALVVVVTKVGEDAFLAQIARHIEEARALKPGIVQLVDRVLGVFVPVVLFATAAAVLIWTLGALAVLGHLELTRAIFAALATLVLGYPCALGMATPLAMMRGGGLAAERGILMRSGEAFQVFGEIDIALLDKTGTLTVGRPGVVEIVTVGAITEDELLALAAAVELSSEHPLARSVVVAAAERGLDILDSSGFSSVTGLGVGATVDGEVISVGRPSWLIGLGVDLGSLAERNEAMGRSAQTVVAVARASELCGLIGVADAIKVDALDAVNRLRAAGITSIMVTGDNEFTARAVATKVGIIEVRAQMLPDEKANVVRELQANGHRVLMVGDGINDAPALAQADIGIAMGAGTDIAIESADVVLVGNRLTAVADARDIGANSFATTRQNLVIAFSFNGVGVPLAVTGLIGPTWAMIAMVSSVSIVLANSFATRLSAGLVTTIAHFLGRATLDSFGMFRARNLRRWALTRTAAALVSLLVLSLGLGMLWVVVLGAPLVQGR
jgi:Cu+-exporting ATPase